MFLRTTKGRTKNYVSIVQAYRDANGKPKQKIFKNLGSFDNEEERQRLYRIGQVLIDKMEGKASFTSDDITEIQRENWGAAAVTDKLFEIYKLDGLFKKLLDDRKIEYDLVEAIKFIIGSRYVQPMSKLRAFNTRHDFAGFGEFDLQHLYRSLDEMHRYQDKIKEHLFRRQKSLSPNPIDVVFFDVTTLAFESQKTDSLREFGFSKDCKFNETQIVLSLMITSDGRPVGYEIFPGNQYEGGTLLSCLEVLREKYKIKKVIIVADRGLSSFQNLKAIKDKGFDYIIASRLGNLSDAMKDEVLDRSGYETLSENPEDFVLYKNIQFERVKRIKNEEGVNEKITLPENLLCLYSSKRARKDRQDRDRLVEKAREMLISGGVSSKRGAKKYLKMSQEHPEDLDLKKIERDAQCDGFYLLSYSDESLSPESVAATYRGLWKIESSFRTMKHFFEVRPMFHWTAERISGHILVNFICLIFERFIEQSIYAKSEVSMSEQDIRIAITKLQRSLVEVDGSRLFIYSAISDDQLNIISALNLKKPS